MNADDARLYRELPDLTEAEFWEITAGEFEVAMEDLVGEDA